MLGACALLAPPALAAAPDPRAQTETLLQRIDTPANHDKIAAPLAKAKDAQTRAQSARGAGDLKHAAELDGLALLWAQVAEDLLAAAAAEQKLNDVQKKSAELDRKLLDTQALVEQAIARRGRAQQNLSAAEAKPAAAPPTPAPTTDTAKAGAAKAGASQADAKKPAPKSGAKAKGPRE